MKTNPNAVFVAELILTLLSNEDLCYYFAVELKGYLFLFDQIERGRNLASAEGGLSSTVKKALNSNLQTSNQSGRKPTDETLQNLSSGAKLLEPKNDSTLVRLIQDTPNVIWSYNFQTATSTFFSSF